MKPSSPVSFTSSSLPPSLLRKTRLSPYLFTLIIFILFVSVLYGEDFMCIFGQLEPNFVLQPSRTPGNHFLLAELFSWILFGNEALRFRFFGFFQRRARKWRSLRLLLVKQRKAVTCSVASGWETKPPDHSTRNGSVRTFNLSLRVKNAAVPTKITSSGGGNPTTAIFPRKLFFSLRFLCFLCFLTWVALFHRFNATLMLETLRGKRMMYVGDSLNRGMYVSMICLLHRLIPGDQKSITTSGSLTVFTAKVSLFSLSLRCNISFFS